MRTEIEYRNVDVLIDNDAKEITIIDNDSGETLDIYDFTQRINPYE